MNSSGHSHYTFGDTHLAAERLRLLAQVFEPSTREFLKQLVGEQPGRTADLGCGPGWTTQLLAQVFPESEIVGLDSSASFLERAKESAQPGIRFEQADITQTLPGGPFDLIYSRYLLAHIAGFSQTVRFWACQLTPGGVIAIEENEWIKTEEPAFARYLQIVETMLADAGQRLHVGADLALTDWNPLVVRASELVPIRVGTQAAAQMFVPNLRTWRNQPSIRARVTESELSSLEGQLLALAEQPDRPDRITFSRRRMILADNRPTIARTNL